MHWEPSMSGSWFEAAFSALPDPRTGNAKRHELLEVLTIALTAAVCGAEHCSDFADFAVDREALFREFLELRNGVPSHDTFSRVFRLLDPSAFAMCFGRFVDELGAAGEGVVAIDGKTLRRSFDAAAGRSPLAVVSAFASATSTVIGQTGFRAADGDSEIVAARALLRCLDLTGQLVTADAIHCQSETAQTILDRGGDYLLRLKANRPALHEMVATYFADGQIRAALPTCATTDADHGRVETRRAFVTHDLAWLRGSRSACTEPVLLPGLACLGMIESTVTRGGKTTTTRHYHVASRQLTPEAYLAAARSHWSIENGLHWVLDMTFDEDRARNRKDNGPENLAILRKLALNVLKRARPKISIRRKRKRSGWSDDFARSVIGQMR
ncbi:Predicted transposase YbfD/YdcC associated with H repeats [Saliniramus fredricksonii]|uniref:Predicted transposase YbfD/YdcC associated with H repeats n=2 Tax=Saliniramus fredricksonii TaxID=1653334 RepID=A0ABY0K5L2_9HYPH|nr:Predicted transposase YbfD/YdcC associated with H repeats [Saliniramus fredricksonii]SCC80727.1 Predicted transposase YbfD/YdcC associated with H repeats [Saliniramus fredricksonii]SCC80928.1 Predicted transposase YbfD/YdcC associated with H repeats [Saliniramus fredricksonii]SCC82354.1 Predicted transposase YbfD/YdcC associated with H repeats [Saliniramus fredricksonii]